MKELSGSSSKEELLKYDSSKDASSRETPSKDLSPDELFIDETLTQDFSLDFEDDFAGRTLLKDLSFEDGFATETVPQDLSSEKILNEEYSSFKDKPIQEDFTIKNDFKSDIGHNVKNSLKAVMQWCDDVANTPTDIITNFRSHLPFIIILGSLILLLWGLRFIYG